MSTKFGSKVISWAVLLFVNGSWIMRRRRECFRIWCSSEYMHFRVIYRNLNWHDIFISARWPQVKCLKFSSSMFDIKLDKWYHYVLHANLVSQGKGLSNSSKSISAQVFCNGGFSTMWIHNKFSNWLTVYRIFTDCKFFRETHPPSPWPSSTNRMKPIRTENILPKAWNLSCSTHRFARYLQLQCFPRL